jgi:hypothetical protein
MFELRHDGNHEYDCKYELQDEKNDSTCNGSKAAMEYGKKSVTTIICKMKPALLL